MFEILSYSQTLQNHILYTEIQFKVIEVLKCLLQFNLSDSQSEVSINIENGLLYQDNIA